VEAPRFEDNRHMKVVRLSALRTGRLYSQETFLVLIATGMIMSMKNFNDTIGNRTRDLPACSAVPQPTAPPLALLRNQQSPKCFITLPPVMKSPQLQSVKPIWILSYRLACVFLVFSTLLSKTRVNLMYTTFQ
jgi:hypothetical protein